MKTVTKALAKGAFATVAAGAMVMGSATPAAAGDRHRDHDGISAGEVIAGAVVLGGLAAILSSGRDRDDYRYRDRRYGDYRNGYDGYGRHSGRRAVEACVRAAERTAQRYTGSRAEVYEIRDVDRERRGYEIEGRIAVRDDYRYRDRRYRDRHYRDSRWGDGRWGNRGYGDYRRGYRNNGWDEGRFKCEYRRGRVVDIDFGGIRGL